MSINGQGFNVGTINGGAQSWAEYVALWLRDDGADVMYLVDLDYVGDDGAGNPKVFTLKLSNRSFPPYLPLLSAIPSFSQQIGDGLTGQVKLSYGTLEIKDIDGLQDAWPRLNIDGQRCLIRYGDPTWPEEMFMVVNRCVSEIVQNATRDKITIRLRDPAWNSNQPIQNTLIANPSGLSNIPVPICLGNTWQISPTIKDEATQTWHWNNPLFDPTNVMQECYDSGNPFGGTSSFSTSSNPATNIVTWAAPHGLYVGSRIQPYDSGAYPPPAPLVDSVDLWVIADSFSTTQCKLSYTRGGSEIDITGTTGFRYRFFHWTADSATGLLYLSIAPAGKLTAATYSYNPLTKKKAGDLLPLILIGDIDQDSRAKFLSDVTWQNGIYIKDRRNRLDIAIELVSGLGAWFGTGRYGLIKFGRVERTNTISEFDLVEKDGVNWGSLSIESVIMPRKNHRIGYRKNFTPQTSGVATIIGANSIADMAAPESITTIQTLAYAGAGDVTNHALAVVPDVIHSLINAGGAATGESFIYIEAQRLDAMYQGPGFIYSWEVKKIGFEIDIGMVVNVTHSAYELSAGLNMTVIGKTINPQTNTVTLKLYVGRSTYTPGQL